MLKWLMGLEVKPVQPEVTTSEFLDTLREFDSGEFFLEHVGFVLKTQKADIRAESEDEKLVLLWLRMSEKKKNEAAFRRQLEG